MSKHETTNQFKDGLMMDVHPLQTPNTVLTDCLNGTFITYNGNEHVLQNDMGNFKLEKCKLWENYIPIGTASYGDILYIASYNPIEKRFELGSYPSPLQWNSTDEVDAKSFDTIIQSALAHAKANPIVDDKGNEIVDLNFTYSELEEFAVSTVIDDEKMKLNPGDKYKITNESEKSDAYIEDVKYFILDENNRKQYIEEIEENVDFKPVSWQIPGYLGISSSILTPYEHKLYVMSTSTGPTSVLYKLRSVISIFDDSLLKTNNIDQFFSNLSLQIDYYIEGEKSGSFKYIRPDWANVENKSEFRFFSDYNQYQWLYDKKQLVYEFELTVDYPEYKEDGDGNPVHNKYLFKTYKTPDGKELIEYYERPTEIRAVPILWNSVGSDVFYIEYDNLKSSVTYTANGSDRNAVAESIFTWTKLTPGNGVTKDSVTVSFDLFKSNEDVKVAVFWKSVDNLLTDDFSIPNREGDTSGLTSKQYVIIRDVGDLSCTLSDVPKDTYVVVFFLFLDNWKTGDVLPTPDKLNNNKLTARFVYVSEDENITSDGRADRQISFQNKLNKELNANWASRVDVSVNAKNSVYKTYSKSKSDTSFKEDSRLLSNSLSDSLFFNTTSNDWKLTQTINSTAAPTIVGASGLISLNDNCFYKIPVKNTYSTIKDGTNYITSVANTTVNVTIDHKINVSQESESYYDFSEIGGFKQLTAPSSVQEIYWMTNNGKGRFTKSDSWDNNYTNSYDLEKSHKNFDTFNSVFSKNASSDTQFKIIQLGVIRKAGAWSRMFSNSSQTAYLCADDKGGSSKRFKMFLMVAQDSAPGYRLLQFFTDGNDGQADFQNIIRQMGYFVFNSTVTGGKFEKKNLYGYSITSGSTSEEELNKKYTLWQKREVVDNPSNKVFSWIFRGSHNEELKCFDYCNWDSYSTVQKLTFAPTAPYKLETKMTVVNNTFNDKDGKKNEREAAWKTKFDSVSEFVKNNSTKYLQYLTNTDNRTDKLGMYCKDSSVSSDVKKFIKCLSPHRNSSGLAKLDVSKYSSTYNPNFYFGCTSNGKWKTTVGYVPASTEWLPSN